MFYFRSDALTEIRVSERVIVNMYTLVRSAHPATGVEHCLSCYFFNSQEKNLVVAGPTC